MINQDNSRKSLSENKEEKSQKSNQNLNNEKKQDYHDKVKSSLELKNIKFKKLLSQVK